MQIFNLKENLFIQFKREFVYQIFDLMILSKDCIINFI
jgi:hypothetical protein